MAAKIYCRPWGHTFRNGRAMTVSGCFNERNLAKGEVKITIVSGGRDSYTWNVSGPGGHLKRSSTTTEGGAKRAAVAFAKKVGSTELAGARRRAPKKRRK